MADGFDIDFSELTQFAASLGEVDRVTNGNVRNALEVSARHVRDDWRDPLMGSATVPAGAYSVTYDVEGSLLFGGRVMRADIGPELGRAQGAIVGLLEEGTPTVGPRGFGLAALQANQDDYERGLTIAVEELP